jgi:predicted nucleic acid-binding protein
MDYLVDTNVISEFIKPQPDANVIRWLDAAVPGSLFASVVTFGEIRLGIENLPMGKRRAALEGWLENGLPAWFDTNLLPVTRSVAAQWGRITITAKQRGFSLSTADGLIAATAVEHGLAIATRNVTDFDGCGVTVINPWGA